MRGLCIPKWSTTWIWINTDKEGDEKKKAWNKSKIFSAVINSVKYVTFRYAAGITIMRASSVCEEPFQPEKRVKIYNEIIFLLTLSYKMCGWRTVRVLHNRASSAKMRNCKGVCFFYVQTKRMPSMGGWHRHLSHMCVKERGISVQDVENHWKGFGRESIPRHEDQLYQNTRSFVF